MNAMTICPMCQSENPLDSRVCSQCGHSLVSGNTTITRPEPLPQVPEHIPDPLRALPGTLALYIMGEEQPLLLHVQDGVILGRAVPGDSEVPDIDLSSFQAHIRGVSRRHARIIQTKKGYALADLNSTNGTWINEKMLKGDNEHPLGNGDMIRLGTLVIFVYCL
jgi:hypothetical protein